MTRPQHLKHNRKRSKIAFKRIERRKGVFGRATANVRLNANAGLGGQMGADTEPELGNQRKSTQGNLGRSVFKGRRRPLKTRQKKIFQGYLMQIVCLPCRRFTREKAGFWAQSVARLRTNRRGWRPTQKCKGKT